MLMPIIIGSCIISALSCQNKVHDSHQPLGPRREGWLAFLQHREMVGWKRHLAAGSAPRDLRVGCSEMTQQHGAPRWALGSGACLVALHWPFSRTVAQPGRCLWRRHRRGQRPLPARRPLVWTMHTSASQTGTREISPGEN